MARGGRRAGIQGRDYSNRTDLTMNARPLPIATATNQPYGEAGTQASSQRALHLAPPPGGAAPGGGGSPAAVPSPGPQPGSFGSFDRGTDRPHEPITAGLASGAGPGPEAMGGPGGGGNTSMAAMIAGLAARSGDRNLLLLAQRAQTSGGS